MLGRINVTRFIKLVENSTEYVDKYFSLACGHYQGQIGTSLKLTRPKRVVIATSNNFLQGELQQNSFHV